jgi:hypothetical protein
MGKGHGHQLCVLQEAHRVRLCGKELTVRIWMRPAAIKLSGLATF